MQLKRQPLVPLKEAAAVIGVMLVCVAPLAVLASENYATLAIEVHLTVFAWNAPVLPLGVVVLFSCLLGALLLYSVSVLSALRDRRALTKLRRRVVELEQAQAASAPQVFKFSDKARQTLLCPVALHLQGAPLSRGQGAFAVALSLFYTTAVV